MEFGFGVPAVLVVEFGFGALMTGAVIACSGSALSEPVTALFGLAVWFFEMLVPSPSS